jgi:uncharacterized protein YjdB
MKTWNRAFAVFAAIVVSGFVFNGCNDGNEITTDGGATGVTLNRTELGLEIGEDYILTATVLPANAADKTVTWSSSRTVIATVDNNGKVIARSLGTVMITATAKNGKKASCFVTVGDVAVTGVSLQPALAMEVGETFTLEPVVQPANAASKNVNWSSDDDEIATVNANGTVTALAEGISVITVTTRSGTFTDFCTVTVGNVTVKSVTLNKNELFLEAGDDETLIAAVLPERALDKTVTWSSSRTVIATVDDDGKVTAVADGIAIITATADNGEEDSCIVTVEDIPVNVTLPGTFYVAVGGRKTLTPTVLPEYLKPVYKTVTWSSNKPAVATVDGDGIVTGIGFPAGEDYGTAIITATSTKDPAKTAECEVTVSKGMIAYMVEIPKGTFWMGSPDDEPSRGEDEVLHEVELTQGFYMLETQVLLFDYIQLTDDIPTWFWNEYQNKFGDNAAYCPADGVTWYDAVEYCNKLSEKEGFTPAHTITNRRPAIGYPITGARVICDWTANGYRLPTEAEWEYACRAGTATPFHTGDNIKPNTQVDDDLVLGEANYDGKAPYNNNEPGVYLGYPMLPYLYKDSSNGFGLIAMHGNLEEWCWDWYGEYDIGLKKDPRGPSTADPGWPIRVTRGGSYLDGGDWLRSAARWGHEPHAYYWNNIYGLYNVGFRIVRNSGV